MSEMLIFPNLEREAGPEVTTEKKESAFADPRFWVSAIAILLTLCLAVGSLMVRLLFGISGDLRALIVVSTQQTADIATLKKDRDEVKSDLKELRKDIEVNQKEQGHYNYNLAVTMARIDPSFKPPPRPE